MTKSSSQRKKELREQVREAAALVAEKDAALANQKRELEELRRKLAGTVPPSLSTSTPPGRGTPSERVSVQGPSRGDRPQQEPIPEEAAPATGEEKGATPEGTETGSDEDDNDGDAGEWNNESERRVMYELLDGFRSQNVSADDRHALMTSAGGQFADMLSRHWTEKSTPPEWLVSLFRPTAPPTTTTPASAEEVAQAIGISPTTLKKLCRCYGISRWPYRQIAGKTRAVDRLGELLNEPSSELPKAVLHDHLSLLRCRVVGDGGSTVARRASSAPHGLVRYGGADTDHAGTPGGAASFILNAEPPSSPRAAAACSAPLSCHLPQSSARDGMASSMPAYCCCHGNGVAPIGVVHTMQMTAFRGRGRYDGESIRPAFSSTAVPVAVAQMMPTPATGSSTPTVGGRRSHVLPSTVGEAEPAASADDGVRSNSSCSAGNDVDRDLVRAPTQTVAREGAGVAPLPRPPPPPPSSWSPGLADFPPQRAAMHRLEGASRPMAATAGFGPQHHGPFQPRREPPQGPLAMPWPTCKGPSRLSYGSIPVQHPGDGAFGGIDAIFGCNGAVSSVSTTDDASGGVLAAATSLGGGATGGTGRGMADAQAGVAEAQADLRSARFDELCALDRLLFGDRSLSPRAAAAAAAAPGTVAASAVAATAAAGPCAAVRLSDMARRTTGCANGATNLDPESSAAAAFLGRVGDKASSPAHVGANPWRVDVPRQNACKDVIPEGEVCVYS